MNKTAEQRAGELYPNNKTFCGGVAQIAREAFVKGWKEAWDEAVQELLPDRRDPRDE